MRVFEFAVEILPVFSMPDLDVHDEALGDELAQRVSRLVNTGCVATIAVVQELTTDTYSHGLALSAAATAWMGSAKAGLTVDQYVVSM